MKKRFTNSLLVAMLVIFSFISQNNFANANQSDDADKFYSLGISYVKASEWKLAIENFKKTSVLDPENPKIYSLLALCYTSTKEYDLAIENFKLAIEKCNMKILTLDPQDYKPFLGDVYEALGLVYYEKKENDLAIESFKKALESKPDNAKLYVQIGDAYAQKTIINHNRADYKKVQKYYEKALSLDPTNSGIQFKVKMIKIIISRL